MSEQVYLNNYKLMNDLNEFNLQYAKYIKCSNNPTPSSSPENCSKSDLTCCPQNYNGTTELEIIKTLGNQLIIDTGNAQTTGNVLYGNLISKTPSLFDKNQADILSNTNTINSLRTDLDTKMREVYNIDGNLNQDFMLQYDSVMYTGILFSILATTLLYYTFTKL